jgi:hypothetical protein
MSNMLDTQFLELPPVQNPAPKFVRDLDIEPISGHDSDPHVLALLFDEISHGVLVVSPQGRVIHSNRAARDAMASSSVLYTQLGELLALSPMDAKLLYAALDKASVGVRSLVKLSGSGITLILSASTLPCFLSAPPFATPACLSFLPAATG